MADITARVPAPISARVASRASQQTSLGGRAIDYAIAGIPFLSAASTQREFSIETAQMQREQRDDEPEPGEQSLSGWWLRSQDSWHSGAGQRFQEPRASDEPSTRFFDSSGVDPWTENELRLLPRLVQAAPANAQARCLDASGETLILGVGSTIRSTGIGGATTTNLFTIPDAETPTDVVAGSATWYAITAEGTVYTGPIEGGTVSEYPLTDPDPDPVVAPQLTWAKHRLWAVRGRRVYTINLGDASGTPQAADYEHPTTDWVFTDIAEGPACVYLAGHSGAESCIQIITLAEAGDVPTLTAGITTSVLPPGELVQRIAVLGGQWMCIVTSQGIRLGIIAADGGVQYGPLFVTPDSVVEGAAVATWDRWFFVSLRTSDGQCRVYRVDTSTVFDSGAAAYARDVELVDVTGYFTDLAIANGRVVAAVATGAYPAEAPANYYYAHESELVEEGWVQFGYLRYRTTELKLYKYAVLEIEPLAGSIAVDAVLNDTLSRFATYSVQGSAALEQADVPTEIGPQRALGIRLTLTRSTTDASAGPVVHSYTVKALPAVRPQRLIHLWLMCYDSEAWHTGQRWGYDGFAMERLAALHEIENSGDLVLWQDFGTEEAVGRQIRLEYVKFAQASPPDAVRGGAGGYGGIVEVIARTMD